MVKSNHTIIVMALALLGSLSAQSCHESLDERAARECKEFTEKNCPQQLKGGVVYDSLTFDTQTHTIHHYYSVKGAADNAQAFAEHKDELRKAELEGLRGNISTQKYKEAGYNFAITICSGSNPKNIYFHTVFTSKDLQ